jgi:hypothetical protein
MDLTDAQVLDQAEQLAAYAAKGGAVSRWLDSKDLAARDRPRVLLAWSRTLERDDEPRQLPTSYPPRKSPRSAIAPARWERGK